MRDSTCALLPPGLFSNIMRELANIGHGGPKWIVLDGDIDPMWIESLNTVMDDNKVKPRQLQFNIEVHSNVFIKALGRVRLKRIKTTFTFQKMTFRDALCSCILWSWQRSEAVCVRYCRCWHWRVMRESRWIQPWGWCLRLATYAPPRQRPSPELVSVCSPRLHFLLCCLPRSYYNKPVHKKQTLGYKRRKSESKL